MAEARRRENWDHTSAIIAAIYNAPGIRKRTVHPAEFNPFCREAKRRGKAPLADPAILATFAGVKVPEEDLRAAIAKQTRQE